MELVRLYRLACDRIGYSRSRDKRILLLIIGVVWDHKHPFHLWREIQPILHHRTARSNQSIVADEGIPSGYLPTRFTVSGAPIWDVGGIYTGFAVLCIFTADDIVQITNVRYLKPKKENQGSKNYRDCCCLLRRGAAAPEEDAEGFLAVVMVSMGTPESSIIPPEIYY